MPKSRIYATMFTALIAIAFTLVAIPSGRPIHVSESITVTALADEPQAAADLDDANSDAHAVLRRFLQSYNPYDVPRNCLEIHDMDGATFEVINRCAAEPASLGRLRVDKVTHTVHAINRSE